MCRTAARAAQAPAESHDFRGTPKQTKNVMRNTQEKGQKEQSPERRMRRRNDEGAKDNCYRRMAEAQQSRIKGQEWQRCSYRPVTFAHVSTDDNRPRTGVSFAEDEGIRIEGRRLSATDPTGSQGGIDRHTIISRMLRSKRACSGSSPCHCASMLSLHELRWSKHHRSQNVAAVNVVISQAQ